MKDYFPFCVSLENFIRQNKHQWYFRKKGKNKSKVQTIETGMVLMDSCTLDQRALEEKNLDSAQVKWFIQLCAKVWTRHILLIFEVKGGESTSCSKRTLK